MTKGMTKEEILAIEAGKEMDALVDKEIFEGDGCVHDLYWVDPEEYACSKCHKQFVSPEPYSYSTDISAAWQVVEKMNNEGWYWYGYSIGGRTGAQFTKEIPKNTDKIDRMVNRGIVDGNFEMPEAICKAALLARLEAEGD